MRMISYQPELSPALRVVVGNVDYSEFRKILERIDQLNGVAASTGEEDQSTLELEKPLDIDALFLDTSWVKASIHFPLVGR